MRKAIPLFALLLIGCGTGPMRLKPGSNVVLPVKPSLSAELVQALLCQRIGPAETGPAITPPAGTREAACVKATQDVVPTIKPAPRPPLR